MGYLTRLIRKLFEPADGEGVEQQLKNDFRESICFSSYRKMSGVFRPNSFFGIKQAEYPNAWAGADAARYVRAGGRKALRLTLDIPTFDSGDRESDSWHTLYLMPGKARGCVDGIYPVCRAAESCRLLMRYYEAFQPILCLNYPLTPHVTLAYFKPGILDERQIKCLQRVIDLAKTWDPVTFGALRLYAGISDIFRHEPLPAKRIKTSPQIRCPWRLLL